MLAERHTRTETLASTVAGHRAVVEQMAHLAATQPGIAVFERDPNGSHTRALARALHGCDRASRTRRLMAEANPTAWTQNTGTGRNTTS